MSPQGEGGRIAQFHPLNSVMCPKQRHKPNLGNVVNHDTTESDQVSSFKPLRTWPLILLLLGMTVSKLLPILTQDDSDETMIASVFGPLIFAFLIVVWWMTFSRAKLLERIVGLLGIALAFALAWFTANKTMHGPAFVVLGGPLGAAAFGIAALLLSRTLSMKRTFVAVIAAVLGFGVLILFRSDGMWGDGHMGLSWRWKKSAEEKLLADSASEKVAESGKYSDERLEQWLSNPEWPQFRGPGNTGIQSGLAFSSDWSSEPKLLWKVPVGPGWSSFAVAGNLLFTQEQLGEKETVSCFAADTGEKIWKHQITERFFDPLGGPGPRATPTLANGMLFAQSASGTIQRLDPKTGKLVWSKDIKELGSCELPYWGFASSPLAVGELVPREGVLAA